MSPLGMSPEDIQCRSTGRPYSTSDLRIWISILYPSDITFRPSSMHSRLVFHSEVLPFIVRTSLTMQRRKLRAYTTRPLTDLYTPVPILSEKRLQLSRDKKQIAFLGNAGNKRTNKHARTNITIRKEKGTLRQKKTPICGGGTERLKSPGARTAWYGWRSLCGDIASSIVT